MKGVVGLPPPHDLSAFPMDQMTVFKPWLLGIYRLNATPTPECILPGPMYYDFMETPADERGPPNTYMYIPPHGVTGGDMHSSLGRQCLTTAPFNFAKKSQSVVA